MNNRDVVTRALDEEERYNEIMTTRAEETIAAVSAVFHGDARWEQFYDTHGEYLDGFPGIWRYCREAGNVLSSVYTDADDSPWIETVDAFVDQLYLKALDGEPITSRRDLLSAAHAAIIAAAHGGQS